MKRLLLASAALTILGAAPAFADSEGTWYVGGGGGGNWVNNTAPLTTGGDTLDTEFETGWALTGDIGYRWWDSGFRVALELGYRSNDIESIFEAPNGGVPTTDTDIDGDVRQFSAIINMLFDFPIGEDAVFTLGAGIGGASADFDAVDQSTGDVLIEDADDGFQLAYQGIAGLALGVSDHVELFAEYRYMANHKHDVITYPPPNSPLLTEADFDNHTATIGLRYFFDVPEEVVEPAPAPAPAPQTNFTIYFNKKGALSSEAHATLQEAADVHKGGAPTVTIEAQGGGPRAGDAVTRALVDLGVAEEKIAVQTHDNGDATITISQ
jgi:opacity protein-like surface antigen